MESVEEERAAVTQTLDELKTSLEESTVQLGTPSLSIYIYIYIYIYNPNDNPYSNSYNNLNNPCDNSSNNNPNDPDIYIQTRVFRDRPNWWKRWRDRS